jgi:5-methylcytosine-specific restriction endonuclease McrA
MSNTDLIEKTKTLLGKERHLLAWLLSHMGEIDARMLYCEHACSSMFGYAVLRLGLSGDEAYKRIGAARLARQFPLILEKIASGDLHLSALLMLRPHLTQENHRELLERATGKSKREIEGLIAELFPKEDAPEKMRKLRRKRRTGLSEPAAPGGAQGTSPSPRSKPHSRVTPSAPQRYKVEFTAGESFKQKLEELKALLWHKIPDGNLEEVLLEALQDSIEKRKRQKFGLKGSDTSENHTAERKKELKEQAPQAPRGKEPDATRSGASSKKEAPSRTIPRPVRRAVFARDGMQCSFVDEHGHRCLERRGLEFQHLKPYAHGGEAISENLVLLCREHNQYAARKDFGASWMREKTARSRRERQQREQSC